MNPKKIRGIATQFLNPAWSVAGSGCFTPTGLRKDLDAVEQWKMSFT
jgi:hypothetical protein